MKYGKIEDLSPHEFILIKGAKSHNLKNIDLAIPKNKFVVVTGLSGSGKSSLAFDTLFAEGQRRYVESLSSYARQFLGKLEKPEVDYIKGISPAIAIEQKVSSKNPRSTVGTSTEIYDYLKLLYTRIGKTISPVSGKQVTRDSPDDVIRKINRYPDKTKMILYAPLKLKKGRSVEDQLQVLVQQGFSRMKIGAEQFRIDELIDTAKNLNSKEVYILIDRFVLEKTDSQNESRIIDSIQTAYFEGEGECYLEVFETKEPEFIYFSNKFELDGITFEEPSDNFFTFNNPIGACKTCEGFGSVIGIDEDLVIPNKSLSIFDDAVACWKGDKMKEWKDVLVYKADKFNFPIHKPYFELSQEQKELLWTGNKHFQGLNEFFKYLESESYKIQYRVMLSRYRGKTVCPDCKGTRLRKDAGYVKINGKSIQETIVLPIDKALQYFQHLELTETDEKIASRLLIEITNRLSFLSEVGLGYLTLNRLSNSLSGGESQRINLATSLGSSLVGSMYILDEPSIGLHSRDTERLIRVLRSLKEIGNSVIVVEHDEEIIRAAEEIIDIGPKAGSYGGEVVFQGNHEELLSENVSLTAQYLNGTRMIEVPKIRRKAKFFIDIEGARENNLRGINVRLPLNNLTVITGVSGSGKSTLIKKIVYPSLKKIFGGYGEKTGLVDKVSGSIDRIKDVEFIDQNPIGKSSRSNPVTYVKAYDEIRDLYTNQKLAKTRGYKPSHFSFNVEGGRCEMCEGEGFVKVEMQFMADVYLTCETCHGKRFKDEIQEVKFREKSISDILEFTIDDAIAFFSEPSAEAYNEKKITDKLKPLQDVGLGYVKLGQPSNTLSGGEAQRIKLASFLTKGKSADPILFIFDEPTTGIHFYDIEKLLKAFNSLIDNGHSLLVIEHNLEVIKCADWIIDLGPEGGDLGGNVVFEGVPEDLIKVEKSHTAKYLAEKLISKNVLV